MDGWIDRWMDGWMDTSRQMAAAGCAVACGLAARLRYLPATTLTTHLDAHRVAVGLLGRRLGLGSALGLELREVLVELRAARALR